MRKLGLVFGMVAGAWLNVAHGLAWESLGPYGGFADSVAANPARNVLYATLGGLFLSENNGATWKPLPAPGGCTSETAGPLTARSDGSIFVGCGTSYFRSRDDGRTWTPFLGPVPAYGALHFDPTNVRRAILETNESYFVTQDDGATWTATARTVFSPRYLRFDPARPGRLLGLGTDYRPIGGGTQLGAAVLKESLDFGVSWTTASVIVQSTTLATDCMGVALVVAPTGALFTNTLCGTFRSVDGGAAWNEIARSGVEVYPPQPDGFVPDPFRPAHVYAWHDSGVIESFDDGSTWRALPALGTYEYPGHRSNKIATTREGLLYVATQDGIQVLSPGAESWSNRNVGLTGLQAFWPRVLPSQPSTLMVASGVSMFSRDGGLSWQPFIIEGRSVKFVHPNLTVPLSVLATTFDGTLYRSDDAGESWTKVAPPPADRENYQNVIEFMIPVGPQPGIVYGLSGFCRDSGFTGCFQTPRDVVRSLDGGVTWKSFFTTGTGQIAVGPVASQLAASPADPSRLLMLTATDVYRSRDRGETWEPAAPMPAGAARLIPDPIDAARWYAILPSGPLLRSDDFGAMWTIVPTPSTTGGFTELLVDQLRPNRLYLVGSDGGVSRSDDRGGSWQSLSPAQTAGSYLFGARLAPIAGNAIYAGSYRGIMKMALEPAASPASIPLVEYYRADLDHYFMTSEPTEIAKLDVAGGPFVRTGHSFGVWSASARDDDAASVCRFYGRPEAKLDSHFFSASPTECSEVSSRFATSWTLESPRIFSLNLPNAQGECRAGTTAVYRLFDNRGDVNHRYTNSASVRDAMLAAGWVSEGYGPTIVVMCSPQ